MSNHRRVLKNTLFLYIRAFISMAIGLYTSRLVLAELGDVNFGIYSIVGSLSMMFAYLNYGISSSLMRFMAYDIANKDNISLQNCFASSLLAATYIGLLIVLLCETAGLWALYNFLDLPPGREDSAFLVFQVSIIILVIDVYKTCCQSLIIANEKMSFFAYISIAESGLKLLAVVSLIFLSGNKLKLYAILLCAISIITLGCYIAYCRFNYPEIRFTLHGGRNRIKEIFSFAGWNTLASFADLCYIQGSNIILNVFYGVTYNATMGITNQVKNTLYSFSKNLQSAANPHLTKEFALRDYSSFERLAILISVLSFLLLYLFGLPILINAPFVLDFWLVNVPPSASVFIRLMIIFCLVDSLVGPLWVAMQSYGRIRTYQLLISLGWILSLPTMWIMLDRGGAPQDIIIVQIIFNSILLLIRIRYAIRYCHISLRNYLTNVIGRLALTVISSGLLPLIMCLLTTSPTARFFATTIATFISVPICTFYVALNVQDRTKLLNLFKAKFLNVS